jgi:DNA-binding HxlR family transcriptional regulator
MAYGKFRDSTHQFTCILQVILIASTVSRKREKQRSGCPVSTGLETFGDRWSLLIVRDLMVGGLRTFKEFQGAGEGIATNILADRLHKLELAGILIPEAEKSDRRKVNYRLTAKGIDLAPALLELLIWGARHEKTGMPWPFIRFMEEHRAEVLAEVRRRWSERDATPLYRVSATTGKVELIMQNSERRRNE